MIMFNLLKPSDKKIAFKFVGPEHLKAQLAFVSLTGFAWEETAILTAAEAFLL